MAHLRASRSLAVALSSLALAACGINAGTSVPRLDATSNVGAESVPGQILVKFRPSADLVDAASDFGLTAVRRNGRTGMQLVKVRGNVEATIASLRKSGLVEYAEPNYVMRATRLTLEPNDPMIKDQYTIDKLELRKAWDINQGSEKTLLAIVDTGIDYSHPEFEGRVINGKDFANNDNDSMDDQGHGTHCAGIAAASFNNGVGIAGVAPGVKLLGVKVLAANGSGSYEGVANGIIYAADQGAKVISMSLGGRASSSAVEDACKYAISKGSLVIAAMGNDGREVMSYPAAIPGVLAVGSTDSADLKSSFSNSGKHISVSAPGSKILSTLPLKANSLGKTEYGVLSGTSMATPAVAGLASLLRDQSPAQSADEIRSRIEKSADDLGAAGFDKLFGFGRVNAFKALSTR